MGRVKKYSAGNKNRRSKSVVKKLGKGNDSSDEGMSDNGASVTTVMSIGKRK